MSDETQIIRDWIAGHRLQAMPPLQPRVYEVHDTITVGPSMGLKLCGSGAHSRSSKPGWYPFRAHTTLVWKGDSGKPFLHLRGCTGFKMEGLNFVDGDVGLVVEHKPTGSLNLTFDECSWIGQRIGTQFGTAWGESTCANIVSRCCYWEGQESAYLSVNSQSVEHVLERPKFAYCKRCVDIQGGGGVAIRDGGPYQCGSLLHLGKIGGNARGFLVERVRFDGKGKRIAWLTCDDTDRGQGYGVVTFSNASQNDGQSGDVSTPLITVPPGCRVVCRDCSFGGDPDKGAFDNWAKVYSKGKVQGELSVQDSEGIGVEQFDKLVTTKGDKAYYEFLRTGSLWGPRGSFSTFPGE